MTITDRLNLFLSAEHWLLNWEYATNKDWDNIGLGAGNCPLCRAHQLQPSGTCATCPIMRYTKQPTCTDTPYHKAAVLFNTSDSDEKIIAAFAEEYTWLVSLALGESPEIGR
jgi:hypothetical protein